MTFDRIARPALVAIGLAMVAYHMASSQVVLAGYVENQAIHLAFVLILIFLDGAIRSTTTLERLVNFGFIAASLVAVGYVYFNVEYLEESVGFPSQMGVIIGTLLVAVVIEATRRGWGTVLPIVALIFIAYFLFGHLFSGPLSHTEFKYPFVISYLGIGLSGIFGQFLSISADQVFLFVVFGSLLSVIKINDLFFELGKGVGRYFSGGPGQTAVISSSLVGTVTGAAVANVAITGAFTIPFMKKVGYTPAQAGGIEATASTGGQIMPPVMGASAFLMASFLGVPYAAVMTAALIPGAALLLVGDARRTIHVGEVRYRDAGGSRRPSSRDAPPAAVHRTARHHDRDAGDELQPEPRRVLGHRRRDRHELSFGRYATRVRRPAEVPRRRRRHRRADRHLTRHRRHHGADPDHDRASAARSPALSSS